MNIIFHSYDGCSNFRAHSALKGNDAHGAALIETHFALILSYLLSIAGWRLGNRLVISLHGKSAIARPHKLYNARGDWDERALIARFLRRCTLIHGRRLISTDKPDKAVKNVAT